MTEQHASYAAKVKPEIRDRIIATANALVSEGIDNPTNDQVRERMGGGSLSHISPVMREWRESRKAEVVAALDMPADLKKAVETSLGQLWGMASKLATASVENFRQEAEAAVADATAERDEALNEIQRLEKHLAELTKALEEKGQEVNQVRSALDQEHNINAQLKADTAALQARIEDRDTQIEGLKADLKEARDDNRKLQGELIEIARKAKE
ncbi:MAG: KfrA protein [Spongiibacter sp.]|uniref:DNA-binding protein n=1 Tax=Gammaproteobacteria TaxID=1236 RepID=UPI000C0ADA74|nr:MULTISPECIES: DNA-binding protein [Gammaproteobacteria]MAK44380.1 KfrA protein [Spongiibacter sp.]GGY59459.1 KfrAs [Bacterioplanes sanyensis]